MNLPAPLSSPASAVLALACALLASACIPQSETNSGAAPATDATTGVVERVFENAGLKDLVRIRLSINSATGSLAGQYIIHRDYSEGAAGTERHPFTGRRAGSKLHVSFSRPLPYPAGPGGGLAGSTAVWTLTTNAAGREVLRITTYGKNYETNTWGPYTMEFERKG